VQLLAARRLARMLVTIPSSEPAISSLRAAYEATVSDKTSSEPAER
jgi:hypothetical protein